MKKVVTVCPYCASGCKINLVVDNGKIVRAEAAQGKTNQGTLCLKGYYGWDFINDTQILTPRLKTQMCIRDRLLPSVPTRFFAASPWLSPTPTRSMACLLYTSMSACASWLLSDSVQRIKAVK